jgi:menaquinone-dependent protoporphyrinogen oxidase
MLVLVAYASRHGATRGIAERIGSDLNASGLATEVEDVRNIRRVSDYDAFVIGGAAYMSHWLKDATRFVKKHRAGLSTSPVWLFSSGPLGTDMVDTEGRDILEATRPKEFDELDTLVHPRGERIFFGAWDPEAPAIGFGERVVRMMPASKAAMPTGDFRDWDAIDEWAGDIARLLHTRAAH